MKSIRFKPDMLTCPVITTIVREAGKDCPELEASVCCAEFQASLECSVAHDSESKTSVQQLSLQVSIASDLKYKELERGLPTDGTLQSWYFGNKFYIWKEELPN